MGRPTARWISRQHRVAKRRRQGGPPPLTVYCNFARESMPKFVLGVRWGAAAMIVAHNRPSGDPTPSLEDVELTRLQKGCRNY